MRRRQVLFRIPAACAVMLYARELSQAQQPAPNLRSFFEQRLSAKAGTAPPSYEALLAVIDTIGTSTATDIQSTLRLLSLALQSTTPNLPVEAAFAYFAIANRSDGGVLLRDRVPELAALMASSDDRLRGAAVTILRRLTQSIPGATLPPMMNELRNASRPNLVKAEIVRTLLESSKRNDAQVLRSVETYLYLEADPPVKVANLLAIAANRVKTPAIAGYAISALTDKDKHVQLAAIQTVYSLGADVRDQSRSIVSKLARDPGVDQAVRSMAERALQGKLTVP